MKYITTLVLLLILPFGAFAVTKKPTIASLTKQVNLLKKENTQLKIANTNLQFEINRLNALVANYEKVNRSLNSLVDNDDNGSCKSVKNNLKEAQNKLFDAVESYNKKMAVLTGGKTSNQLDVLTREKVKSLDNEKRSVLELLNNDVSRYTALLTVDC